MRQNQPLKMFQQLPIAQLRFGHHCHCLSKPFSLSLYNQVFPDAQSLPNRARPSHQELEKGVFWDFSREESLACGWNVRGGGEKRKIVVLRTQGMTTARFVGARFG
jgi:hypothetical protein